MVTERRELHIIGPPECEDKPVVKHELSQQQRAALMFYDGASMLDLVDRLGVSPEEGHGLLRNQFKAITDQAEKMLTRLRDLSHEYLDEHKRLSEPKLDPTMTEKERLYREAKSDLYFDVAQALQLIIDAGWQSRVEGKR